MQTLDIQSLQNVLQYVGRCVEREKNLALY